MGDCVNTSNDFVFYKDTAKKVRRTVLDMIYKTKSPHIGPSFSVVEILVALYSSFLKVSPDDLLSDNRDRFILSKGHACATLYAVLAEFNFIGESDLKAFAVDGGVLEHHPSMDLGRGIEVSTGSLGHGLSVGAGMALAGKADGKQHKICVLMSDGELNEGSVWESVMFAAQHKLSNLTAIVDCNKIQALGYTKEVINLDPVGEKWKSFGWNVQEVDGHSYAQIFDALSSLSIEVPNVLLLHTVKGKGVSFMEDQLLWHYRAPDDEEYGRALRELL